MNKRERINQLKKNWDKYHVQGMPNYTRIKRNAVFISTANSLPHELKKLEVCFQLKKEGSEFVTEAERSLRKGEPRKRVDIVNLTTGDEIEIICDHETHLDVLNYRAEGIIPVIVNPFQCKICKKIYPIKLKKHEETMICDNCQMDIKGNY